MDLIQWVDKPPLLIRVYRKMTKTEIPLHRTVLIPRKEHLQEHIEKLWWSQHHDKEKGDDQGTVNIFWIFPHRGIRSGGGLRRDFLAHGISQDTLWNMV